MLESLSAEELAALDIEQLANLQIFVEATLNQSAEVSRVRHGAPDCSAHIPTVAEKVAKAVNGKLKVIASPDFGMIYSKASFSLVCEPLYDVFEEIGIGHEQYRYLDYMLQSWAADILRNLLDHPQVEALRST